MSINDYTWQDWHQLVTRINAEIDQVHKSSKRLYGDYAYSAGYLGSALAFLIAELPEDRREQQLESLRETVNQLEKKYVAQQLAVDNTAV